MLKLKLCIKDIGATSIAGKPILYSDREIWGAGPLGDRTNIREWWLNLHCRNYCNCTVENCKLLQGYGFPNLRLSIALIIIIRDVYFADMNFSNQAAFWEINQLFKYLIILIFFSKLWFALAALRWLYRFLDGSLATPSLNYCNIHTNKQHSQRNYVQKYH